MTTFKSAEEAYNAVISQELEREKTAVAKAIDNACAKKQYKCFAKMSPEVVTELRGLGYSVDEQTNFGKVQGYIISWEPKKEEEESEETGDDEESEPEAEYTPVDSTAALTELLASDAEELFIEVKDTLEVSKLRVNGGKKVTMKIDGALNTTKTAFIVDNGATLTLTGTGRIESTDKGTTSIMEVDGPTSAVIIDGPTISSLGGGDVADNYHYGIFLINDASLTLKSGKIECAKCAAITTNNTLGGASAINIEGGEVVSTKAYAMYLPSHNTVTVSNNATVQGIVARMGKITVKDNAKVLPTAFTSETYTDIGNVYANSGFIWPGDTISVLAGTYSDPAGTDCEINVEGNATVASNFRAAIGVYKIDTKEVQNVTVNVANKNNVTTTDAEFDAVKVYDHDYIREAAQKFSKNYEPKVESNVKTN